jgi:hypothetical protein
MTAEQLTIPAELADKYPGVQVTSEDTPMGVAFKVTFGLEANLLLSQTQADTAQFHLVTSVVTNSIGALQDGAYAGLGMAERYAALDGLLGRLRRELGTSSDLDRLDPLARERVIRLVTETVANAQ